MNIRRFFAYLVALVILFTPFYKLMFNMKFMSAIMVLMIVKMITDWSIKLIHAIYKRQNPENS